ncbi:MAG: hypothetical protein M1830_006996 [Pleopsidium flavum]|nr:MAG: hypothetical protein M1830_006996 [Pleopsidium flavum]
MKSSMLAFAISGLLATAVPINDSKARGFDTMSSLSTEIANQESDTENHLGDCAPLTVIFARGTVESGNVGALAGPPFFKALDAMVGANNVAVQGVDYGATIDGYLEGGDPAGAATLASLAEQAASQCPKTQIILSGYSQGAQVVHLGAAQIPALVASRVTAVVLFGDPEKGQRLQNISADNVSTFCFVSDLICYGKPIVLPSHLSYSLDAYAAAAFVKSKVTL